MTTPTCVIFLNGSYGVGKSSALDHMGDVLAEQGRPFSLLDVDWFHRSWPPAEDDPENVRTEADNLAAVWGNYRRTGPRQPVVAGVLTSALDRRRYEQAFGLPVRAVRLVASAAVAEARLRGRYTEHQDRALDWHLRRHVDLGARLALADLDELLVDTDRRAPRAVAELVVQHFDVLGLGSS
ncbi:hypothetical protein GCM10009616_10010 [Microlunatus lacustris]